MTRRIAIAVAAALVALCVLPLAYLFGEPVHAPPEPGLALALAEATAVAVEKTRVQAAPEGETAPRRPAADEISAGGQGIRGRVVDASGDPVPDALVSARSLGSRWARGADERAVSSSDGSFVLPGAGPELSWWLTVEAEDHAELEMGVPSAPPGSPRDPVELILDPGWRVFGNVEDAFGDPLPGAEVALYLMNSERREYRPWMQTIWPRWIDWQTTSTDEDGAFEFTGVEPGRRMLTVVHPEHMPVQADPFDVRAGYGEQDVGTFVLDLGAQLRGVVRDSLGDPVGSARVLVVQEGNDRSNLFLPLVRATVSAPDGTFRVGGLADYPVEVSVVAEGHGPFAQDGIDPLADALLEARLAKGATLEGRVVAADGSPAAGAVVRVWRESYWADGGILERIETVHEAGTGDDGRFRFETLAPGEWQLGLLAGGAIEGVDAIELQAGEERELDLRLSPQSWLAGVVVDPWGAPVAGAVIKVESLEEQSADFLDSRSDDGERRPLVPMTDAAGRYLHGPVSSGRALVATSHAAWLDNAVEVVLAPGANDLDLEVASGSEISGVVTSSDGFPVPFVRVVALRQEGDEHLDEQLEPQKRWLLQLEDHATYSDRNGAWRIAGLAPGTYELRPRAYGYLFPDMGAYPVLVDAGSVSGVHIVLERGAVIEGIILGRPVEALADMTVFVEQGGEQGGRDLGAVDPGLDGRFRFDSVPPGTWTVRASDSGWTVERTVTVEASDREKFVELTYEPGLVLNLDVLAGGQPLDGARVFLSADVAAPGQFRAATTDRLGRIQAEGLTAGSYEVAVQKDGLLYSRKIEVKGHDTVRIDFEPPAFVSGTVIHKVTRERVGYGHVEAIAGAELTVGTWDHDGTKVGDGDLDDGKFEMHFVAGESVSLVIPPRGNHNGGFMPLDLAPGERRIGLVVEVEPDR